MSNALARSATETTDKPNFPWLHAGIFVALTVVGAITDVATKYWVFEWQGLPGTRPEPWWIIRGFFGIETAVNQGALAGVGQGKGWLFAILSILAAVGILVWMFRFGGLASRWLTFAMGAVLAGIFGNLYDRLGLWSQAGMLDIHRAGVRDWILFCYRDLTWPNFNIADCLLVVGAIMLAIHSFMLPAETTKTTS